MLVSQLAWAAITKSQALCSLNNRNLSFIVVEASKSKIKVLAHSFPGEYSRLSSCLQMTPCCVLIWQKANSQVSLLIRALFSYEGLTCMISPKPNCLPKGPSPNTITSGIRVSTQEGWRYTVQSKVAVPFSVFLFSTLLNTSIIIISKCPISSLCHSLFYQSFQSAQYVLVLTHLFLQTHFM